SPYNRFHNSPSITSPFKGILFRSIMKANFLGRKDLYHLAQKVGNWGLNIFEIAAAFGLAMTPTSFDIRIDKLKSGGFGLIMGADEKRDEDIYGQPDKYANQGDSGK
ncbi:MAG: hypothetical protein PHQ35_05705, partial [Phycisphaerae bacterium]|nr:hypothetical protein [Phycisphaerae bacterium]MDD5380789.1 hypothetical protein [Phycisphaerae bacterium]